MVTVIFETQNSTLDYYLSPMLEFCLSDVALMLYFKVVLTVALSGYVIRLSSQ